MIPGLLIGLTVHEFAHAWVAYRCGDPTAYWNGRVTLNPLAHVDPVGLICLVFFRFGWGRPVPVNPSNFRHYRNGQLAVSLAGIISNVIVLLLTGILMGVLYLILPHTIPVNYLMRVLDGVVVYNASLAVFNLLPIPPLDGSKVLMQFLPYHMARIYRDFNSSMGMLVLMFLSVTRLLNQIMGPPIYLLYLAAIRLADLIAFRR